MGNHVTRVMEIDDIEGHLENCEVLKEIDNPAYGNIHYVRYDNMTFNLGMSHTQKPPHPMSLHYFVPPNALVFTDFQLLEDICPQSLNSLLHIITGICQMAHEGGIIGIGRNRIGYSKRWGVVGEQPVDWAYNNVLDGISYAGAYLSPQLMISLSQGRRIPKHNAEKSDMYALGIMLIEIISQKDLSEIFDYDNYEIRLNSLLQVLLLIRQQYGDQIYQMFIGMLQTEEADRFSFEQLYQCAQEAKNVRSKLGNSRMNSSTHSRDMQRGNRTPTRCRPDGNGGNRTPKGREQNQYQNGLSPFRGRFAPNARMPQRLGRTPDRNRVGQQQTSRSPLRRELKINTQFGRESHNGYGNEMGRRALSPISRR